MTDHTIELTCIEQIEAIDEDGFFFWGEGSEQKTKGTQLSL